MRGATAPRVAYVYPGQGAQAVGMGLDLYAEEPSAREVFEEADETLGFSLSRLCFEGPEDVLRQTVNAQPALLTVSIAVLRAAQARLGSLLAEADFVAGHSLGEYTALVAAGALSFADALRLVRERGRLMHEAGQREPGTMAAVLSLDRALLEAICSETGAQMANINAPDQIVISGPVEAVQRAMAAARAAGARRVVQLDVSGAFHSRLMAPAAAGMAQAIAAANIADPRIPVIANVTARPLYTAEEVRQELLQQLTAPVQWQGSIEELVRLGVARFYEMGPGRVLTGLIARIAPSVEVATLNSLKAIQDLLLESRDGEVQPAVP